MPSSNGFHIAPREGSEHEFRSGTRATIADGYPVRHLIHTGVWDDETLTLFGRLQSDKVKLKPEELARVIAIEADIVRAMFIVPRIARAGVAPDREAGEIAIGDLPDADIDEVLEIALAGGSALATFPGDEAGGVGSANGEGVADKAERAAGSAARKRSGVQRGRKPRAAAGGGRRS